MTRINLFRLATVRYTPATLDSVAWGKINFDKNTSTLVFAALLIVCSIAVGCSSEKPKTEGSTNPPVMTQPTPPAATTPATAPATPAVQAAAKPIRKKVVRKVPASVTYADKTSGVSFQYPRKYSLETGDAANELVSSDPVPMDFVQPGGVALAAVTVPESAYPNSDLASAYFNVSLNKALTAEQCGEFSVPQASPATPADLAVQATAQLSKLMIGDMELKSTKTLASQGSREEASKYYHVFENGACYEFALRVATTGVETEGGKHVDREQVFQRLEKILATVKITPAAEVTASAPAAPSASETPAQYASIVVKGPRCFCGVAFCSLIVALEGLRHQNQNQRWRLAAHLANDCSDVVLLEQSNRGDASSPRPQTRSRILQSDPSQREHWDLRAAGLAKSIEAGRSGSGRVLFFEDRSEDSESGTRLDSL